MNHVGKIDAAENAAFRAFYRFADGGLPFRKTDKMGIQVNGDEGSRLLEFTERLQIKNHPSLSLNAYSFSNTMINSSTVTEEMSAVFHTQLPMFAPNGGLLFMFTLETYSGIWGVRSMIFYPTPAQAEIFFHDHQRGFRFWLQSTSSYFAFVFHTDAIFIF